MTTPTCTVCGAAEQPGRDHTCPVCGADLPEAPVGSDAPEPVADAPADLPASEPFESPAPESPAFESPAPEYPAPESPAPESPAPEPAAPAAPGSGPGGAAHDVPPPPPSWPAAVAPAPPPPPGASPPPPGGGTPARSPYDPAHPSGLSSSVRTYGMLTHLSAFLGALTTMAFTGPLIMWLIRRDEHPFLDHHGKEALNFNLSMLLYLVIGFVASLATLGLGLVIVIPATMVFFVTWVVTTIIGAVKANAGEGYRYPLTIRFIQD